MRDRSLPSSAAPNLPSPAELVGEMFRLSREVEAAVRELRDRSRRYAQAEHAYAKLRAQKHLEAGEALLKPPWCIEKPTVPDKGAYVDLETTDERLELNLQQALMRSAKEALESRRSQLSALQSVTSAVREELAMARTGPGA